MNSAEAKEMTKLGMWTKINSCIRDFIVGACGRGEYEINISNIHVTENDIDRLVKLGYCVTYDGTDKFDPRYYISWKC